jgi:signal peptidase
MSFAGRAVGALANALIMLALLLFLVLAIGPYSGRYRTVTVLSGSMEPTLHTGAVVIVTPVAASRLRPGDVLTFNAPLADRRVVTHRVVSVQVERGHPVVRTQGDANPGPDPWEAVLVSGRAWKARAMVPRLGSAIIWARGPLARHLSLQIVPAFIALSVLVAIWRPPSRHPKGVGRAAAVG